MKYHDPLKQILAQTRSHWDHDGFSPEVRNDFSKALQCRTSALGAEVYASKDQERIVYHTCKSRACPSCGHRATIQWQRERWAALPNVRYKAITFTMPDSLWKLFREKRPLAAVLPTLAGSIIEAWMTAKNGLRVGGIAILHTFNGRLEFNSHVHTMVSAGGLRASSGSWVSSVYYDRDHLMNLWRSAVIKLLRGAHRMGLLRSEMMFSEMEAMLTHQAARWWSVKIQSFKSKEHFLRYAGRYVRRPPIAQRRITFIGDRTMTFWTKDKKLGRWVDVQRSLAQFIGLWAQHIPRRYQHAVRYVGLLAPRAMNQTLPAIFAILGQERLPRPRPIRWADSLTRDFGRDPLLDQTGHRMHWGRRLAPAMLS